MENGQSHCDYHRPKRIDLPSRKIGFYFEMKKLIIGICEKTHRNHNSPCYIYLSNSARVLLYEHLRFQFSNTRLKTNHNYVLPSYVFSSFYLV